MIGGFALLRHVVQAAAVVPFALHVLIGRAADEGPVRRGEPVSCSHTFCAGVMVYWLRP